jgi:hypothetical protein
VKEVCQPMDVEEKNVFDDALLITLRNIDTVVVPQRVLSAAARTSRQNLRGPGTARKPRGP